MGGGGGGVLRGKGEAAAAAAIHWLFDIPFLCSGVEERSTHDMKPPFYVKTPSLQPGHSSHETALRMTLVFHTKSLFV